MIGFGWLRRWRKLPELGLENPPPAAPPLPPTPPPRPKFKAGDIVAVNPGAGGQARPAKVAGMLPTEDLVEVECLHDGAISWHRSSMLRPWPGPLPPPPGLAMRPAEPLPV